MKIKIINKILAGFLAASTIGLVAGVVFATPKKHLCSCQSIYDLNESCESEQSDYESDEEEDKQKSDVESKSQNPVSQFVFLLKKPIWEEWDEGYFFEMCLDFSQNDFLGECSLKHKLKVTDILTSYSFSEERQEQLAEILRNFSHYNFFKAYSIEQRIDITDALIECLGQDSARDYVVETFSNLAWCNFFKEYPIDQKLKIAKTLTRCLSEEEFDWKIVTPLRRILEDSEIFAQLNNNEKRLCLDILKRF